MQFTNIAIAVQAQKIAKAFVKKSKLRRLSLILRAAIRYTAPQIISV